MTTAEAQALLATIEVAVGENAGTEGGSEGLLGYATVGADASRKLSAAAPALAVRLRQMDPQVGVSSLAWS